MMMMMMMKNIKKFCQTWYIF